VVLPLRQAAGLPDLGFHTLRHTFITRCAEAGVGLQVAQSLVGHMSAGVTRRYTHISDQARRAAVDLIGEKRTAPRFVDIFVDTPEGQESNPSKLLN
jgi:integrase